MLAGNKYYKTYFFTNLFVLIIIMVKKIQANCNQGPVSDKKGFSDLVIELKKAFEPKGYLLSAAVSPSKVIIDAGINRFLFRVLIHHNFNDAFILAYDVPILDKHLDWIGVMTYDYHGQWDRKTGHVAPMYYYPGDDYDYFNLVRNITII